MGHTGYIRLGKEIKNGKNYYRQNLYMDCKKYIENCPICLTLLNNNYIFLIN